MNKKSGKPKLAPSVELDQKSLEHIDARNQERRVAGLELVRKSERAEAERKATLIEIERHPVSERLLVLQRVALVLAPVFALPVFWDILRGSPEEFVQLIRLFGFNIRPYVILSLLAGLSTMLFVYVRLCRVRENVEDQVPLSLNEDLPALHRQSQRVMVLLMLVEAGLSVLLVSLGGCVLGIEPALTYLGGGKAAVFVFGVMGLVVWGAFKIYLGRAR